MSARLPPAEMRENVVASIARAKTAEQDAFRRASMSRLRVNANQLRAAMVSIADNDVEFTKLYGVVIKDDLAWEQMLIDLETMANLARVEE
jgi:hypothetical protein